jgi:hypothetical protein
MGSHFTLQALGVTQLDLSDNGKYGFHSLVHGEDSLGTVESI